MHQQNTNPIASKEPLSIEQINAMLDGRAAGDESELGLFNPAGAIPGIDSPDGCTEAVNAKRFVEQYGDDTRYCDPMSKFLHWDERRWALDDRRLADVKAKGVGERIREQAAAMVASGAKGQADALQFMRASNSARGIRAMIDLVKCELPISAHQLDADPWALNCANGTVDLRSGKLRPHRREDFLTKLCPTEFDLRAECPLWLSVVDRIMAGNEGMIRFLQRLGGCSLAGIVRDHVLPFCYGVGANGKSVFLGALLDCLGTDYAMKAPPDLLMTKRGDSHPTERADLFGKRFVACIEAEDGRRIAEGLVKEITGGDKIRARRMREDFWEFSPSHTVWLAANHKPIIGGNDHGIWRRVKLIPFEVIIPDREQDRALPEKLRAEFPGILGWLVRGCLDWQAEGLCEPPEVKAATADYRSQMDVIGAFIDECCLLGKGLKVKASKVRECYEKWCDQNGETPMSGRRFGERLRDRGVTSHTSNGTWYDGLDIQSDVSW